MEEMRNAYSILVGKPKRKSNSEDLRVDGRISECILRKQGVRRCGLALGNTVMKLWVP
jgi:hypothetical protein